LKSLVKLVLTAPQKPEVSCCELKNRQYRQNEPKNERGMENEALEDFMERWNLRKPSMKPARAFVNMPIGSSG